MAAWAIWLLPCLGTPLPIHAQASAGPVDLPVAPSSLIYGEASASTMGLPERPTPLPAGFSPDPEPPKWLAPVCTDCEATSFQRPIAAVAERTYPDRAGYQWRGFIWQNVAFNLVENGFRVSADDVMRDTLAHRPFWHNYTASLKQFNWRRWNDGDIFIVNYIGHSMHGAVAAYIEMQNSPVQSRLEWGDPGYAKSRFKGFLWAAAFSTHSELSPAGEAGVGNEGGFTYGVSCQYNCNSSNFKPGDHYTNNTGWVDFIATPTTGMLWVVTEDLIDKYLADPLYARHPGRFWPKVVRGSLTPARSFSNLLRLQSFWYRDFEHPLPPPAKYHWFHDEDYVADHAIPRVQVAPLFSNFGVAANTASCFNCRRYVPGGGLQTTLKLRDWLGFDSAVSYHPGASPLPSDRAGGDMLYAVFGLSATRQWRYYTVHAALRPGLVRFSDAYVTSPRLFAVTSSPPRIATHGGSGDDLHEPGVIDANNSPNRPALGDINHFVWDFNLSLDYRLTRRIGFRIGLDDPVIRYRTNKVDAPGVGEPPYVSWLSKQQFINRGNFNLQMGPVFSF